MIVVDTSGLLAVIDAKDQHHRAAVDILESDPGPFLLSPFVLAEFDYMVVKRYGVMTETAFLRQVTDGLYSLVQLDDEDVAEATRIIMRYEDMKIGLADASIAVIAGRARTTRLLSLDERHFRAVRPVWGDAFTLLPKDPETSSS